jgi:hypothetical protein
MRIKMLFAAPIAALAIGMAAAPALAQDCFIVNRSTQGAIGASNSGQWIAIPVTDALFPGAPATCVNAVNDALTAAGYPTVLATMGNRTLLQGTAADANGKTADGKGVDHFEDSPVIGQIMTVAFTAAAQKPS